MGRKGPAVMCRFQYSGAALVLPAGLAAATVGVIAASPGPAAARVVAAAAVICLGLAAARRLTARWGGVAPRAIAVRVSGEVAVQDCAGEWVRGELRDGSFVAPWLTIVRWRPEGRRFDRTVLLMRGMAPDDEFRRLRVLLRWA
ncbi:MAG TPA: protein YgfX [Usitatibacter sp.]|nr:protein YgfX [Usitatibacter sp.]